MALFCLAALWSFAEATLFFIAPDALLSIIALRSLGKAMTAALLASFAAAFGGLLVWTCAQHFPEETLQVLLLVPGISGPTFEMARQLLQAGLFEGLLGGAFSGIPYKVLSAEAGYASIPAQSLFLVSPVARLPRFVLVALISWSVSRLVGARLSDRRKLALCLAVWPFVYANYFLTAGW
ncbi:MULTISPECIES: hypothetical protein [Stappiaceae]|uniref:hypothetical protein n=1 Tax=Stappiaceae TaxID=2821832 RepID=UPI00094AE64C|nr:MULTISPECIES: hypothetical protein [Stappiaceae]MBO9459555.1 hypothetical protein [Labrenzia sp. R5_0]UFI02553.1 hypothetical protein ST40_021430 [Roseibium aggregatum]